MERFNVEKEVEKFKDALLSGQRKAKVAGLVSTCVKFYEDPKSRDNIVQIASDLEEIFHSSDDLMKEYCGLLFAMGMTETKIIKKLCFDEGKEVNMRNDNESKKGEIPRKPDTVSKGNGSQS